MMRFASLNVKFEPYNPADVLVIDYGQVHV